MKAAVLRSFGRPLEIEERADPVLGEGDILVKLTACGVCHTDLHAVRGDWPLKPRLPLIPGHEGTGSVVAVGPGVSAWRVGDRVGVPWLHSACGSCRHCRRGWGNLCAYQKCTGYSVDGAFAGLVRARADFVVGLPEGLGMVEAAPLMCAGLTTFKGLREMDVEEGEWAAVFGAGGLGHIGIQYALAMGLRVAAVDIAPSRLELARELGAELTIDASAEDPVRRVQRELGGVQGVLMTAVSSTAFRQGLGMLDRHGTMVVLALPPGEFQVPVLDLVLGRKTVRGSIVGTPEDLAEALEVAVRKGVRPRCREEPLEAVNEVLGELEAGTIDGRVVLRVD